MGVCPVALYNTVYNDVSSLIEGDPSLEWPDMSVKVFAAGYLLRSVIRKWIPTDSTEADRASKDAFASANKRCADWKFSPEWEVDRVLIGEIRKELDSFFHPKGEPLISSYFDLLRSGRPGPGVNIDARGTSLYSKYFSSPLTSTSEYLYEEYRRYAEWIPNFSEAERQRYEEYGSPRIVHGSRCSFVPKTSSTSRMICVEPSVNMYWQLGLAHHLEKRLREYFGIDLKSQPEVNRRLARVGSEDGTFATIDLSSASDSISLRLCELVLPQWVFDLLLTLRSPSTELDGRRVPLFMVSTMGNGFTFPLQTIIFCAITKAVLSIYGRQRDLELGFSVFGDDIICPAYVAKQLVRCLGLLNFLPNLGKTFLEGPFRESCGADWFRGQPVRPVFVKKLDLPFDILVAINLLNEWSTYTGIPLRGTIQFLTHALAPKFRNYVPFESGLDSGIRVPSSLIDHFSRDSNHSYVFKTWERQPSVMRIGDGKILLPKGMKNLMWNPSGLYVSFLYGEIGDGDMIMIRHDLKLYRKKLRCTPRWDYMPFEPPHIGETRRLMGPNWFKGVPQSVLYNGIKMDWRRWETAVLRNQQPE